MKIIILIIIGIYCLQGTIACLRHYWTGVRSPVSILDFFRMTFWPYIWWNPSILKKPGKRLRCVLGLHKYMFISRDYDREWPLVEGGSIYWEVHECKHCGKEISGYIGKIIKC